MRRFCWMLVVMVSACTGDSGADGVGTLVVVDEEPAGEHCPGGGLAVHSGADDNADGVLDQAEIDATAYVCNGDDGIPVVVRFDDEPPGANCNAGGVAVHAGLDANANGVLDDSEITSTTYVCHASPGGSGVLHGSYWIHNDLDVAALRGYTEVTGQVYVTMPGPATLDGLESLAAIDGELQIEGAHSLTDLGGLDGLTFVGALHLLSSDGITSLLLPELAETAGWLQIEGNQSLATIQLPMIATIGANASFAGLPMLTELSMPTLGTVAGQFAVSGLPSLTVLSAPALTDVAASLSIQYTSSLPNLSGLAAVQSAGGVYIRENDGLTSLGLDALVDAGPALHIVANPNLPTCEAEALRDRLFAAGWSGTVTISDNDDTGTCP